MSKIARPLPSTAYATTNESRLLSSHGSTFDESDSRKSLSAAMTTAPLKTSHSPQTTMKSSIGNGVATQNGMDQSSSSSQDNLSLVVDGRVTVPTLEIVGTLRFIGQTKFKPGLWTGIELDTIGAGKNDGTVQGIRYFSCPEQTGLFVLASKVTPVYEPAKQQRHSRERIKTHVRPVASKSARVSSKSSSSSSARQTPPLPNIPTAAKRSITTRLPANKSSITTRPPKARASASPSVNRRPSTSPIRQRASALPSVKRSSTTSSSSNTNTSISDSNTTTAPNKRASAVRISISNPTVHVINSAKVDANDNNKSESHHDTSSSAILSSSPSLSSVSSPQTQSTTGTTTVSTTSRNTSSPTTTTAITPPPPPLSSSPSSSAPSKPLVDMEEMHQLYDLLQRTQREKDILVEQMQNKDAAFERLVSAKESYALQVEDKEQAMMRAQRQVASQQTLIDELETKVATFEEKAAQHIRDDATEEQYVRRVSKLETLVATLQEQATQAAQASEQRASEHAGQLDLLRRELDQEKQMGASLEKESDALRQTGLDTIRAYEQSVEQLKQEHAQLIADKDNRLRHTQYALENLKRQLHSFDTTEDGEMLDDVDLIMSTYSTTDPLGTNDHHGFDHDNLDDDDGLDDALKPGRTSASSHHHRLSSQQQEARSWSEQRHRLEDQLDLTMTELENERTTMRALVTELETQREEIKQLRRHQHGMQTQYEALQKEMTNEIDDKRRLMEEADAAFEAQAKAEDELYQLKIAYAGLEKQQPSVSTTTTTTTATAATTTTMEAEGDDDNDNMVTVPPTETSENFLQQQLKELEQQASHYKEQYHVMEQECMRLMDEMLAMADDTGNADATATTTSSSSSTDNTSVSVKALQQQLKQAKHDHEQELLGKQIENQKLCKELAELESLVETKVFGQGDTEEALEKERRKIKQLEKQLAQLTSSSHPPLYCEMCEQEGHELLSCQAYKSNGATKSPNTMYCEYCDAHGNHSTEDCPDQDETF
ncbi:hypothetical protein BCR42DRAFT_457197 [Absidia repens]|uniref:CAP-Gly domain-containing protein n=1 Tax=Absidia repens TaxID=90262 RepID=A0A1X2HX91_9FUNG|nr:hypothetical protein BCR42DRAFT_457197 [Absidia repens]